MRQLIVLTHLTHDGIMQAPGGPDEDPSNGFTHGGWAMRSGEEAVGRAVRQAVSGEFAMLLGRRTYDIFAGYWPHHDDNPIGQAFNRATKYIATRTLKKLDWAHAQPLGATDLVADLRQLKASPGPDLHVWGSSNLLQTLIAADLIDEYRQWIVPIVLGTGKRLFEPGVSPRSLTLLESQSTPTGVLLNSYRPAGPSKRAS